MTVEEGVCARLETIGALTALVGTRIYQLILPQNPTLPAVRVQVIGEVSTYSHDGRARVLMARVQVDAYAAEASGVDPYAQASVVADAIQGDGQRTTASGLDGYQGDLGSPAFRIRGVQRVDRSVSYEAEELRLVRVRQDYQVAFYQ